MRTLGVRSREPKIISSEASTGGYRSWGSSPSRFGARHEPGGPTRNQLRRCPKPISTRTSAWASTANAAPQSRFRRPRWPSQRPQPRHLMPRPAGRCYVPKTRDHRITDALAGPPSSPQPPVKRRRDQGGEPRAVASGRGRRRASPAKREVGCRPSWGGNHTAPAGHTVEGDRCPRRRTPILACPVPTQKGRRCDFWGLGGEGLVKPWPRRWHLGGLPAGFSWNPGAGAQQFRSTDRNPEQASGN